LYHAVDVERQPVAALAHASVVVEQTGDTTHLFDQLADRQAPFAEPGQRGRMAVRQRAALDRAQRVGIKRQRPLRGDRRVELAQRTRRAVARIGQYLAAMQARMLVVFRNRRAA
jgi:hypothetical protein